MEQYNLRVLYYTSGVQYKVYHKPIGRLSDFEREAMRQEREREKEKRKNENADDKQLRGASDKQRSSEVSLSRSKQNIIGIARANEWDYFITLTFNPRLVNRENFHEISRLTTKWFDNLRHRYCQDMKYLLVPEYHHDGKSIHVHGLIYNVGKLPLSFSGREDSKGNVIYNLPSWKYGFTTATEVVSQSRVASYLTKYISKETVEFLPCKNRYWASKNCLRMDDVSEFILVDDFQDAISKIASASNLNDVRTKHHCRGVSITYLEDDAEIEEHKIWEIKNPMRCNLLWLEK